MAEFSDIEEYRKLQNKKKKIKHIAIGAVVVALLIALFFVLNNFKDGNLINQNTEVAHFPLTIKDQQLVDVSTLGNNIALVSKTSLLTYTMEGSRNNSYAHGYANPVIKEGTKRVLTYDRGGNGVRVDSQSAHVGALKTESTIITAEISQTGSIAVVTNSDRYACVITVYNPGLEEVYKYSSTEKVSTIGFSPDGRYLLAAAIGNKNGVLSTNVYKIDTHSNDDATIITINDILPISVAYENNGTIMVIGQKSIVAVNQNGEQKRFDYQGDLLGFDVHISDSVIIATKDMFSNDVTLSVIDTALKQTVTTSIDDDYVDLYTDGSRILLLGKNAIYNYNVSLQQLNNIALDKSYNKIVYNGTNAYVLGADSINKYRID